MRYNKAHVRHAKARSKLNELKISEKEYNLYELQPYFDNIFKSMGYEIENTEGKIKITSNQMETILNEIRIKKIDLKFKKLDLLAFFELNWMRFSKKIIYFILNKEFLTISEFHN